MRLSLFFAVLAGLLITAMPVRADAVATALTDAMSAFAKARPRLPAKQAGVDVAAYGDALSTGRFASDHWGSPLALDLRESSEAGGSCGRFAAYVSLPPRDGTVRLTLCPQFSAEGTRELRRLTILHEMVHVVAGPNECRAMAFAAQVEVLATGSFTPVDRYWSANDCDGSGFNLP